MKMKQLIPLIALLPFLFPADACGQGGYGMRRAKTEAYIIIDTFYGNPTVAANYRKTLKAVENLYPTIMYFDQWEFDKLSPRTRSAHPVKGILTGYIDAIDTVGPFKYEVCWRLQLRNPSTGQIICEYPLVSKKLAFHKYFANQREYIEFGQDIDVYRSRHSKGVVVSVDESSGDKALRVTVTSDFANSKDRNFMVLTQRGGAYHCIGRIYADRVESQTLACSVKEGGKEIMQALSDGNEVIAVYHTYDFGQWSDEFFSGKNIYNESDLYELPDPLEHCNEVQNVLLGSFVGKRQVADRLKESVMHSLNNSIRVKAYDADAVRINGLREDYFITADAYDVEEKYNPDNPLLKYSCDITWQISVTNKHTGQSFKEILQWKGVGKNRASALNDALNGDMKNFAWNHFPVRSTILTLNDATSKKAKMVTISVGTSSGLHADMTFDVFVKYDGRHWMKLGELKLIATDGPLRSSCKVTKGGKDIKKALEEGQEIMVVSDKGATTKNSQ